MSIPKSFSLFLSIAILLVACDPQPKTTNPASEPLVVGSSVDNRPWEFYKEGKPVGFDVELAHVIGERLGRPVVIKDMSFDGLLGALQSKTIHMAISAMTPTDERRKAVDMTQMYHVVKTSLVCLKSSPVKSLQDLKGLTLGVQQGSTHELYAKQELVSSLGMQLKSLNKIPELIQEIKINRVACLIIGKSEATAMVEELPILKSIEIEKNSAGGEAIALPKGSPLTPQVEGILDQLKKDGTLKALGSKWLQEE